MKKLIIIFIVLAFVVSLDGCIYDFIAPEETVPPDTTVVVSYATQIQPIFDNNCILCHRSGGTSPNLTSGSSYSQINTAKFINATSPSQSLIYRRVIPAGGFSGHPTVSSAQAALILSWLQQGAKNN